MGGGGGVLRWPRAVRDVPIAAQEADGTNRFNLYLSLWYELQLDRVPAHPLRIIPPPPRPLLP